jgi:riboflavin kinase/FMN adenylyltransferase
MSSLGTAAAAIGVFDGVHLGHQALLRDTVADAASGNHRAIAVTFDRDPDQVVSAATAAPQLLTLSDKLEFIAETGVDLILVVPFTPMLADMAPESFVDGVLLGAMRPTAVHVGHDFRFGADAAGDVGVLQRLGLTHDFEVRPYDLVEIDGSPVTSTRIRGLIAEGDVAGAARLLGRQPRVTGTVHRGRGEGVGLGFPTANIVPVPFAALPADGVYAGRALLDDGENWAAAISVGTPPTFPDSRDYLEAHLVDFEGDLYGHAVTLEFFERLRDLRAYGSLDELTDAIASDVSQALEIAGFDDDVEHDGFDVSSGEYGLHGDGISDPAALEAAESAVRDLVSNPTRDRDDELVVLADNLPYDTARLGAIDAALHAAELTAVWEPFPPQDAPLLRRGLLGENKFRVSVWNSDLDIARAALQDMERG